MKAKALYEFDEQWRERLIKMHLGMRGGNVTGPLEGAYGEVYTITYPEHVFPRQIAAKCPRIKRFGSAEMARVGVEQVLHELEKTHRIFMVPWVNRFADVQFIHGWPFIISRYRDGSLEDLIANPLAWSPQDRLASLIQIARALRLAQSLGIAAHQDLKPGNVLFDDLSRKGVPKESSGMHFHIYVADFGLADAFRDLGRNNGSRPYMAPEQFSVTPIDPTKPVSFDIFALAVMAFEVFTDGSHPIGVKTSDVWPWRPGIPQKWNREPTWREWANTIAKSLPLDCVLPSGIDELILASLSADHRARPSLLEFENQLWESLRRLDATTHAGLEMQVNHLEGLWSGDAQWPHMEQRQTQLRRFYSAL